MNQPTPPNNHSIFDVASLNLALAELIPISAHMGIKATFYDGRCLRLAAPLQNNVNHQLSAFGGSLFSISALAGWSILQLKLAELKISANTVIAGGDVGYSQPVFEDLECIITLPLEYEQFAEKLIANGKASITLSSDIVLSDSSGSNLPNSAMNFTGKYVVRSHDT